MSQQNVDLLRRGFEHVERTGEFPPDTAHPNFVWETTTFRGGMQPRTCVGIDETNAWLAEWVEGFDNWSLEVEEVFDAGDQVVTIVRQRASAKHGGPEVEMRVAQVWVAGGQEEAGPFDQRPPHSGISVLCQVHRADAVHVVRVVSTRLGETDEAAGRAVPGMELQPFRAPPFPTAGPFVPAFVVVRGQPGRHGS